MFQGYFGHFLGLEGIFVIFSFRGILVIFQVSVVFRSFYRFRGVFW